MTKWCQTIGTAFSKSWFYLRLFRLEIRGEFYPSEYLITLLSSYKARRARVPHLDRQGSSLDIGRDWKKEYINPSERPQLQQVMIMSEAKYITAKLSSCNVGKDIDPLDLTSHSASICWAPIVGWVLSPWIEEKNTWMYVNELLLQETHVSFCISKPLNSFKATVIEEFLVYIIFIF